MQTRPRISGGWISQSSRTLAASIVVMSFAGCSDSELTPDVTMPFPHDELSTVVEAEQSGSGLTIELPAEEDTVDPADDMRYPLDEDADDPAGMIVTGLDELVGSQAVSPWLVSVRLFRRASGFPKSGELTAELTRYAEDFPVSAHIRFFSESLDTCVIRNAGYGMDQTNPPPPGIGGGETVVLNMPSGPWLSLERTLMSDEQLQYQTIDQLPGSLPESTMLSIPGGAFPTVAAYPLFETEAVQRLSPALAQPVTEESRFSWIPLNQQTHVKIDFTVHDENGYFQGFPVSCWVEDDGAFDMPVDVLGALELLSRQIEPALRLGVRYSRVYSRVDLMNGIVFFQRMEIAE